jgi:hypothetical protein
MFSAAKLVVAGAIVALFGGLSLSGALTPPTDTSVRSDILPGVDLVTEEIEPEVYRVLGDGVRDLSKDVHDVAVSSEGDVWVELGTERKWSVARLGEQRASAPLGRRYPWGLGLTSDDVPVVGSRGGSQRRLLDGESWASVELTAFDECMLDQGGVIGPNGACWTLAYDGGAWSFESVAADGSRTTITPAEIGLGSDLDLIGGPVAAPDGAIWVSFGRRAGPYEARVEGLATHDGSTWSVIPFDGDDHVANWYALAIDANGIVWLANNDNWPITDVLSFDGESWTPHELDLKGHGPALWPWPNGIVWFGTDVRWDGSSFEVVERTLESPSYPEPWASATAPDGSLWVVADEQLYVITPKAAAATE